MIRSPAVAGLFFPCRTHAVSGRASNEEQCSALTSLQGLHVSRATVFHGSNGRGTRRRRGGLAYRSEKRQGAGAALHRRAVQDRVEALPAALRQRQSAAEAAGGFTA